MKKKKRQEKISEQYLTGAATVVRGAAATMPTRAAEVAGFGPRAKLEAAAVVVAAAEG